MILHFIGAGIWRFIHGAYRRHTLHGRPIDLEVFYAIRFCSGVAVVLGLVFFLLDVFALKSK